MDREDIRSAVRTVTVLESTSVSDTFINLLINQGLQEIAVASDWPWMATSATVSLADSTRTAALPADFLHAVSLVDDDVDEPLPFVSHGEFFDRVGNDTGNESASPSMWTVYENDIYFSPIPSSNDTDRYTLYYYASPAELDSDDDVPPFVAAYHWILVEYCKWKLYEREEYYDVAEQSFNTYARYLDDMIAFYGRRVAGHPGVYGIGGSRNYGMFRYDPNLPWWNRL